MIKCDMEIGKRVIAVSGRPEMIAFELENLLRTFREQLAKEKGNEFACAFIDDIVSNSKLTDEESEEEAAKFIKKMEKKVFEDNASKTHTYDDSDEFMKALDNLMNVVKKARKDHENE